MYGYDLLLYYSQKNQFVRLTEIENMCWDRSLMQHIRPKKELTDWEYRNQMILYKCNEKMCMVKLQDTAHMEASSKEAYAA